MFGAGTFPRRKGSLEVNLRIPAVLIAFALASALAPAKAHAQITAVTVARYAGGTSITQPTDN